MCGMFGIRRDRDLTIYDVRVAADAIASIINYLGRAGDTGHIITGPVWEYFVDHERLFRPTLRQTPFADHDALMQRASLVVGHGGHGTTMRALRHGLPIVGMPARGADQVPITRLLEEWQLERADLALPIGRNAFRAPRVAFYDLSIIKQTRISERLRVGFEANFFNIFNHAIFAAPGANLTSALFGQITRTLPGSNPRQIQFGMKFSS